MPAARAGALLLALRAGLASAQDCTPETYDCYTCGSFYPCGHGYTVEPYRHCSWMTCYTYYHCIGIPTCCPGYDRDDNGECCTPAPTAAPTPGLSPTAPLTVATLNLGCRWVDGLKECDNCETRFEHIAKAIAGSNAEDYFGVPDFDSIDVLLVQELGAPNGDPYAEIDKALKERGFVHSTMLPAPTEDSFRCAEPPFPDAPYDIAEWLGQALGASPVNGGLVTWSKKPIVDHFDVNWCFHGFPAPSGYLVTLVNANGAAVAIVNTHLYPDYSMILGDSLTPKDIRSLQFAELAGLTQSLAGAFQTKGVGDYSVIVGGDLNEDMYGNTQSDTLPHCAAITEHAKAKFVQLGMDLEGACVDGGGAFGRATWDVVHNDLTALRADDPINEVLDYVVLTHSSQKGASHAAGAGAQTGGVLQKKSGWFGNKCAGSTSLRLCEAGTTPPWGSMYALSDHNWLSSTFELPTEGDIGSASVAFQNARAAWEHSGSQAHACGNEDVPCWEVSDCCGASTSWSGEMMQCMDDFHCRACKKEGDACTYVYWGTECCNGMKCDGNMLYPAGHCTKISR